MTRNYGRSLKGERVYDFRPYERGTNITTIGAISLSGFKGIMTVNGGCDKNVFKVFIEKILVPNLWDGACLVMDNLSTHKVKEIRDIIERKGVKIIYLSPYSPDFNPIENCWSKIKEYLRSIAARSREELEKGLVKAIELVTTSDIRNWFAHCCYCTLPAQKVL